MLLLKSIKKIYLNKLGLIKIKKGSTTELSSGRFFFVIGGFYLGLIWITNEYIYANDLYYQSYSGTLTNETIEGILSLQSRFWWAGYVMTPILLLFKFLFASICINIGVILSGIEIKFNKVFKVVLLAEVVFIIAQITFITILYLNLDDITLQNASGYFPFSTLSFIGIENVNAQWAIYPLQTLNLFEVFYMIAIAWLLSRKVKQNFADIFSIVLPSYGVGLLLWITLVAFLTFQVTG